MNVCLIGHFGGDEIFYDGQTVKTQMLEDALHRYGPQLTIYKVDTFFYRRNKWKFFRDLAVGVFSSNRILLCVSKRGRRVFFPICYILAKLFHKKVFHSTIGGRLADEARENKKVKKYLSSFRKNWVESRELEQNLWDQGITNAEYLPNFKFLPVVTLEELPAQVHEPLRCVIFSRVSAEKGVGDAIDAVTQINREREEAVVQLDIFGSVQEDFASEFDQRLAASGHAVRYCGTVSPGESVSVIQKYDVLLFPTRRYWWEGMPGTIIDALASGVPVIARRWRYCDEMITHGETGYCYDFDQPQQLRCWLEYALSHQEELLDMKVNCLTAAQRYCAQTVAPVMVQQLLEG